VSRHTARKPYRYRLSHRPNHPWPSG
jgi:hypothetical protein